MAQVIHLRCQACGEPLARSGWPYCAPCNLDLCYRAMPVLLGIFLTTHLRPGQPLNYRADLPAHGPANDIFEEGDEACIMVAYKSIQPIIKQASAYLDEPCIMVAY